MSRALPPELALAAACCAWPLDASAGARLSEAAARVEDWDRFDRVVRRNRITLLVHHALSTTKVPVPDPYGQALARRALTAGAQALGMARASLMLQRAFEEVGLPAMIVKGASLAMLAYGRAGSKESCDVDLLTTPEAAAEGAQLLVALGYHNSLAHLNREQWQAYARFSKEVAFTHPTTGLMVELHWGLTDSRRLLRGVRADGPAQEVAMPGGSLRTLAGDELFAYLCLHGAAHNWTRMKWLADLNALIAPYDDRELERLLRVAERYRAGRAASVALLLCHQLFGREIGDELLRALSAPAMNRALARNTIATLAYRSGESEHERYTEPWLRTLVAQFLIERSAAHVFERVRWVWNDPIDRKLTPLPKQLDFLYPVLRIPLWLARFVRRIASRDRS